MPFFFALVMQPEEFGMSDASPVQGFPSTHWTRVQQAVREDDPNAAQALAEICDAYWYPLYAYFRRCGKSAEDAEDLTQGFFARLLERRLLSNADAERGRLRTYLLACAKHHMLDERAYAKAAKRDGWASFDAGRAELRYTAEPVDELAPDRLYQRRWALGILEKTLASLEREYADAGTGELFIALRPFLGFGPDPAHRYEELSKRLAMPVGTLKNRVFRMRERWRSILFEEVAATLENPTEEDIKAELAELLGCV